MKITKTLARRFDSSYFRKDCLAVCKDSISLVSGIKITKEDIARVTVSNVNPKKKGFTKVSWNGDFTLVIKNKEFTTLWEHKLLLKKINVQIGQSFWMKAEIA